MRKFTFLYFRRKGKCQDTQRGNEKGRPEGSPYGYAVRVCRAAGGGPHIAALSVGVFDAADVTDLTAIVLQHEDPGAVNPHKTFTLFIHITRLIRRYILH